MKKACNWIWRMAVLMMAAIPACWAIAPLVGLEITLNLPVFYAWCTLACLVIGLLGKMRGKSEMPPILLPLALVYGIRLVWTEGIDVSMPAALTVLCVMGAYALRARRGGLRIVCSVCAALLVPMFVLFLFAARFPIGKVTVVSSWPSPSGRYVATVTDIDQGALGGNTLVETRDGGFDVNLGIVRLRREKARIALLGRGAYENMDIVWTDDNTLVVDGKRYLMDEM